jgi:hypothetical protein
METLAIEIQKVQREADETLAQLIQLLSKFNQEQLNAAPFESSWTAGQLAQHLIMADGGFVDMINGPVKETQRNVDELVSKIKTIFLNFDIKMSSPDFIVPQLIDYEKEELVDLLNKIKSDLNKSLETLNLTKTCTTFELPVLGFLTRLEAVYFIIYHTQRHIHQLTKIYQKVVK